MKKFIYIAALSLISVACAKEAAKNVEINAPVTGFRCTVAETRTELNQGVTTWSPSDQIGVFSGSTHNVPYVTAVGGATADFTPSGDPVEAGNIYNAYYPYAAGSTDLTAIPVSAPYEQAFTANSGSWVSSVKPALWGSAMASQAVDGMIPLAFYPVLPVLEFGFVGSGTLSSVEIELLGNAIDGPAAKFLSGDIAINLNTFELASATAGANAAKIKAIFTGGVALDASTPVRIQLVTGRFVAANGLKLTFTFSDNSTSEKTIWSSKTVEMYDSAGASCRHIYQPVSVPAPAPSFLPDATRPIYIFGDLNGWNEGNVSTMFPMFKDNSSVDNYVYKYIGYLPRGSYKFIPEVKTATGTYHAYCNDEAHGTLYFDETGNGIAFWNEVAGFKDITIDVFNLTYSISDYDASSARVWTTMGVIGTINGWGADWDMYPISAENNHIWVLDNAEVGAGDGYSCVKFRAEDNWDYSWQNDSQDTPGISGDWQTPFGIMTNRSGAPDRNIYFGPQAGTFKFIFNDISLHYWVLRK
ncbi:MAG: hypothetical protein IKP46_04540 [Bacteroidales bacterium]|nr:hypothetical protein [Bacteroidales bacterium]